VASPSFQGAKEDGHDDARLSIVILTVFLKVEVTTLCQTMQGATIAWNTESGHAPSNQ